MLYDMSQVEFYIPEHTKVEKQCTVRFDGDDITVEYFSEGNTRTYKGWARGLGHYELSGMDFNGRANLHRFEGSDFFEGAWVEEDVQGMWLIRLG